MVAHKESFRHTFQLIADILSFNASNNLLEEKLAEQTTDWDSVVMVASKHLILPAVYCRLKQKNLLKYLPEELVLYLEELTKLNRNRNIQLLKEANEISRLFEKHSIDHVFIKGVALLAGNHYQDLGERMVGDIDILVASKDLETAFNLLVTEGYSRFMDFNYTVENYRHFPRQISESQLGAIELHDQLLKHGYNHLLDKEIVLASAHMVNGIKIPQSAYLIQNSIFAHQINDKNYYLGLIRFKTMFDILALEAPKDKILMRALYKQKYSARFLRLSSLFFPELSDPEKELKTNTTQRIFLLMMQFPIVGNSIYKIKLISIKTVERFQLILTNKSYRKHIFKNKILK